MAMEIRLHPLEFTHRDLPPVCAATGEPADWLNRMGVQQAANPLALLLFFLGPIGWVVLFVVLSTRPDGTYVEIPLSQPAMDALRERQRRTRIMLGGMVLTVVAFAWLLGSQMFPVAWLVLLALPALSIWTALARTHRIKLTLDGVGLVTLKNVHPNFVAAVEDWRKTAAAVTPRP